MSVFVTGRDRSREHALPLEFRESDARCLEIGLINNMPDAAFEATERQFLELLAAAADGFTVRLRLFGLPGVVRSDSAERYIASHYSNVADLWEINLDGVIVTGTEPRAADLRDEPYWRDLTALTDWADRNTHSSVWSCLAAHAAVLHLDGIARVALGEKCFGVFDCAPLSEHELTGGVPARLQMPHSRWNDLPEDALTSSGYRILTRADAGVDSFVKHTRSLLVFFQGHPEYEAATLLLEYRRDVRRYLRQERDTYPPMPRGYFHGAIADRLAAVHARAIRERREDQLAHFPTVLAAEAVANTWRCAAARVYRNWLTYISAEKARRLRTVPRPQRARARVADERTTAS
jgi:homoserine O-succinyltransferase